MKPDLFSFDDYKMYLKIRLSSPIDGKAWGARSRLSMAIGCQSAYTARVLNGATHLSLEQAEAASRWLAHDYEENKYFINLVLLARAGTATLRSYFQNELARLRASRKLLKNRLDVAEELRVEQQMIYYSAWYYVAVHVLVSLPQFQSVTTISKRLKLETELVEKILHSLVGWGLVQKLGDKYRVTKTQIHLGADSPLVSKHHANWRLQAIQALDRSKILSHLHYSSVVTISRNDMKRVREILMKTIEKCKKIVRDSADEEIACFTVDLFGL